jgi:CMP-N-acetylneuraminic acid synthetase
MNILAIIPARGGSKGIPRKNLRKLVDKPLITYSITAAKNSKYVNKIIVSTDEKSVANIAKDNEIEAPFMRPKRLSRDNTPMIDVVKHTVDYLKNQSYLAEIILILQPTSPLRTTSLIDESIRILTKSNATSVIGVSKITTHPYGSFLVKNDFLVPFTQRFEKYSRRQDFPILYYPTGSIYVFWRETLEKYNSIYGPRIKPMIVKKEYSMDIDDKFDFFVCEMTLRYWNKFKKHF